MVPRTDPPGRQLTGKRSVATAPILKAPIPENEAERLAALRASGLLDSPPEERFDRLTRLARQLFNVPIALVVLIDSERQWFKSRQGLDVCETSRDISICAHAILHDAILEVPDTTLDARFSSSPLVTGAPGIRYYAGAPLSHGKGLRIGTLCIIDTVPRPPLTTAQRRALRDLADCAEREVNSANEAILQARLNLSLQRSADIVRGLPDIVFVALRDGTLRDSNDHPDLLHGRDDIVGRRLSEFLSPDLSERSLAALGDCLRSGQPTRIEYALEVPGGPAEFEARFSRLNDDEALVVIRNVTAEHAATTQLRESEQRLAGVIEGTNIGTWEWNVQTGETVFNERWADIVGYTLAELQPVNIQTWLKLAHPDDLQLSGAALERHFNGELDYYDIECRMRHKQGHWVWVHDRGRVVTRTPEGLPERMFGTHADITEQKLAEQALRDSEQQFRSLVDSIPGTTFRCRLDEHWSMLFMSAQIEALSGYPASDFIGSVVRSYVSVIHPDDREHTEQTVWSALRGDGKWQVEYRILRRDGGMRWVQERGTAVRDAEGEIEYLDGFILDISAERDARQEIERQLEAFSVLNEVASGQPQPLTEQITQALRLAADYLELECGIVSRVRGDDYQIRAFVAPPDMPMQVRQHFPLGTTCCALTLQSEDLLTIEHMAASPHRSHPCYEHLGLEAYIGIPLTVGGAIYGTLNFSSRAPRQTPFRESEKMFLRLLARWTSSTIERERALQSLRRGEARLRGLFELSPIGIALNDFATGAYIDVNDALLAPTGYTREEFLTLSYWDLTPPEYLERENEQLARLERTGRYGPYEKEYLRKDGRRYPVLLNGTLLHDPDGRRRIWSIVEDISERKRMERMKNEFISTVSHELRTPVTALSGALGMLRHISADALPEQAREMLGIAEKNSLRLGLLIDDLLDMEKLAAGKLRLDLVAQPLRPIIEQAVRDNQTYADQFNVRFELTPGQDPIAQVDTNRFYQVLANLLSNAAKFSPHGERVEIDLQSDGGRVRVSVVDHGPGIPAAFRERIFQKFSQSDASDTRQRGGTGLGLAISRELVERMHGCIGFESVEGHGATFRVHFPHTPTEDSRA